jgi:hypothetical protein
MSNYLYFNKAKPESLHEEVTRTKQQIQSMSGSDVILKELQVKGLATFTAFENRAIKVVFDDRTIVRMQQGQELIKLLSKTGEELVFNIHTLARNQSITRECQNYVQVATEFLDWVFLTSEE